ncbi:MAG: undecaprenyl-diphosphate phosphatase [Bdellovibrionota bacterium]
MSWLHVVILGIIEGITEYLPVSSTGHLVIASSLLGIEPTDFSKAFDVIIQSGAILAVLLLYWRRFLVSKEIYFKLLASFIPTAILGFALKGLVDHWLESNTIVGLGLLIGGIFLWWLEKKYLPPAPLSNDKGGVISDNTGKKIDDLSLKECAMIGLVQSIALIPGVSRSGASIVAGLFAKLSRKEAAEFSFLLAVPTLLAATGYKTLKIFPILTSEMTGYLAVGTLISFVVAVIAIKGFIHFLNKHGFIPFAYYRIVLGIVILVFLRG